jgi:elongator complex protein 1
MSGGAATVTNRSKQYLPVATLVILGSPNRVVVQDRLGRIIAVDGEQVVTFPEPCPVVLSLDSARFLGLSQAGRLYCNERLLATGCTSFALGGDFVIYTTLQHEMKFLLHQDFQTTRTEETPEPVFTQVAPAKNGVGEDEKKDTTYGRRVERGSRIVTVIPSTMSIVLQMPRGNLETISPRPLVLQQVRKALDAKEYREAFMTCRRHRIDINILCDHDYEAFLQDLPIFIDQINDNEHLGLFISGLKSVSLKILVNAIADNYLRNEDVTKTMYRSLIPSGSANKSDAATKVNAICHQLRQHLQNKDLVSFANAIMTSYVCQQPPDLESALRVITAVKRRRNLCVFANARC